MPTLNLVIADKDQSYLDMLVDFLYSKYGNRFYVQSFSNEKTFNEYIEKAERIDILLISPEFCSKDLNLEKVVTPIVLSAGVISEDIKNFKIISKYQTGDKLVSSILNIFSETSNYEVYTEDGDKRTKVITFYSPCGGAGKSTLAIGTSVRCAQNNMNIFYLNLEKFPSTTAYFDSSGNGQNFSNILYYLKDNNKNLSLKIEGCRSIDSSTGVHYFLPSENVFDIDELTPNEVKKLVNQLKKMGFYDAVIIDVSSELSSINISILEYSDLVYYVLPFDTVSKYKLDILMKGYEILNKRQGIHFLEKTELILNKCVNSGLSNLVNFELNGKTAFLHIPYIKGLDASLGTQYLTDLNNPMGNSVNQIVHRLTIEK